MNHASSISAIALAASALWIVSNQKGLITTPFPLTKTQSVPAVGYQVGDRVDNIPGIDFKAVLSTLIIAVKTDCV
ncbi:MAG TPA: hypothetical protein VFB99_02405, partial [Vicinamibacterales bacterium]|nr:hypothetical protein [Vicinamibacterales bacterium]